jgi:8-amino-7-oxononanoate synthase
MRERGFDVAGRLADRQERELRRELQPADRVAERAQFAPPPYGSLPVLETEEQLIFASNNYLGLAADQRVVEAAANAAETVGTGAGASRLVTGDTMVHQDLEARLAETKSTDRALAFSSGYAANVGTIAALSPDIIFSDEYNHASIIDGCRLADAEVVCYDHCDADALEAELAKRAAADSGASSAEASWLVVTDSVFSMDGTVAPLDEICSAAEDYGAWVMVDEAHATGLYSDGGGVVQCRGLSDRVQIQLGTLSKALGSQGGYVAGDETLIEYLVNEARSFVFSTGLAPPAAAAAAEALHICRTGDRQTCLWGNVERLRSGLEAAGFEVGGEAQILPVMIGDREQALALDRALTGRGIVAPAIRPPTVPEGTSRIRVTAMATHDPGEIDECVEAFRAAGSEIGIL